MTDALHSQPDRPLTLRGLVESLGVPSDEIERAERDGTLGLMMVDRLVLPDAAAYDVADVSARASLAEEDVRHFWRALGFPDPRPGERLFSDFDVEMLKTVNELLDLGLVEPDVALQMARVIGSSLSRVATAQLDAIEARVDQPGGDDLPEPAVMRAGALLPTMPKVLDYVWRRHLQASARRRMVREAGAAGGTGGMAVGFADLVGFTALSQQLPDHELAAVVERFEALAHDTVVSLGGRVVKMIGDEAMFTVESTGQAAEMALTLAETYHDDENLSDVRVGLACGPVLEREGDVYGPVVNLASRIVGISYPGSVVVSDDVHAALEDTEGLEWRSMRARNLKDLGRVRLWVLRRARDEDSADGPLDAVRARRDAIRQRARDAMARRQADRSPG